MLTPLLITGSVALFITGVNVFAKNSLLAFGAALCFMGTTILYEQSSYPFSFWFDSGMALFIIYSFDRVGKYKLR